MLGAGCPHLSPHPGSTELDLALGEWGWGSEAEVLRAAVPLGMAAPRPGGTAAAGPIPVLAGWCRRLQHPLGLGGPNGGGQIPLVPKRCAALEPAMCRPCTWAMSPIPRWAGASPWQAASPGTGSASAAWAVPWLPAAGPPGAAGRTGCLEWLRGEQGLAQRALQVPGTALGSRMTNCHCHQT